MSRGVMGGFRLPLAAVAAVLALLTATPSTAMHATGAADPWSFQIGDDGNFFSVGASVGLVEGTCSEKVFNYPAGKKFLLSDLKWDYRDVTLGGVMASAGVGGRYRANVGYWSAFRGGTGLMVDRDWVYDDAAAQAVVPDDSNWTHESRHPDTSLDGGTMLDVNVSVLALRDAPFSLRGVLGFKRDTWNWSARGGTYIYSDPGFRDSAGTFAAGEQVIEYRQEYSIPYLGIGGNWSTPRFLMDAHLLASPAVWASTADYHDMRDLTFEGDFFGGVYLGLGLTATYAITPRWAVTLRGEYQSISHLTGDLTMTSQGTRTVYADACGVGMDALMYSLGTSFRF
jgi:outer membrane protease